MNFTDEQFKTLQEAEPHFESSRHGWVKYATREICNTVADVYFQATGQVISHSWSCSICVLNLFRRVGALYFEDKTSREELNKVSIEPEPNALEPTEIYPPEKPVANKNKKHGSKSK